MPNTPNQQPVSPITFLGDGSHISPGITAEETSQPSTNDVLDALTAHGYMLEPDQLATFFKTGKILLPDAVYATVVQMGRQNATELAWSSAPHSSGSELQPGRGGRRAAAAITVAALLAGGYWLSKKYSDPSLSGSPSVATSPMPSTTSSASATSQLKPTTTATPSVPSVPNETAVPGAAIAPSPASCETQLAALPIEKLIAQTIMIPVRGDGSSMDGKTPAQNVIKLIQKYDIGGVIVMTEPTSGIRALAAPAAVDVPLVIAIDDEGGIVNRFMTAPNKSFPSQQDMAKKPTSEVTTLMSARAKLLKSYGINTNFAPVLDVTPQNGSKSAIGQTRIFSADPAVAAQFGTVYAESMLGNGINPVYKHFGGGGMTNNTDNAPGTVPPLTELKKRDLVPYVSVPKNERTGLMMGAFMPSSGEGAGIPASKSAVFYTLAKQYGFNGPIFTDDIGTRAAGGNLPVDFIDALKAGATMPLYVQDQAKTPARSLEAQIQAIISRGVEEAKSGTLKTDALAKKTIANSAAIGTTACTVLAGLKK